ncbi:MAG TPA: polyketide synthase [Thermoanaerobaculia bacterium]
MEKPHGPGEEHPARLIVISALDSERLEAYARKLLDFVSRQLVEASAVRLLDLAFTLQIGRESMPERVGFPAASMEELRELLERFLAGDPAIPGLRRARVATPRDLSREDRTPLSSEVATPAELLRRWIEGQAVDFRLLYRGEQPRRISIPTYPFAANRYRLPDLDRNETPARGKIQLSSPGNPGGPPHMATVLAPPRTSPSATLHPGQDGVARITVGTEGRYEATPQAVEDLARCLLAAQGDRRTKVVLLEGIESVSLAAGTANDARALHQQLGRLLLDHSTPVVAVMKEEGRLPGWLLASLCDLVLCSEAHLYRRRDWKASGGEWLLLKERFGSRIARMLLLDDGAASGADLKACGLMVTSATETDGCVEQLAAQMAQAPRQSLIELKKHFARDMRSHWETFTGRAADSPHREPFYENGVKSEGSAFDIPEDREQDVVQLGVPARIGLSSSLVRVEAYANGVVSIALCDEGGRNMFSPELVAAVTEAFDHVRAVPHYKAVVLAGSGEYFASGGTREGLLAIARGAARFTDAAIYRLPLDCELPVIAAMQGHAAGAGWAMGLFCDLAILAEESVYHAPYMQYGFTPGAGSTLIFPHRLGPELGREILFTGNPYKGRELKSRDASITVLPRARVHRHALSIASRLAMASRQALIGQKAERSGSLRERLDGVIERELAMHELTFVGNGEAAERIANGFGTRAASLASAQPAELPGSGPRREPSAEEVLYSLCRSLAEELHFDVSEIRDDVNFLDMGVDSVTAVIWTRKLRTHVGLHVEAATIYDHPTIRDLATHLLSRLSERTMLPRSEGSHELSPLGAENGATAAASSLSGPGLSRAAERRDSGIAIIGMAGQFPEARDLAEFWGNLDSGRNCISKVPGSRWPLDAFYDPDPRAPGKTNCRWMGVLDDADLFDPLFFDISPREAELMDPQQRLFLQACWHCIEDAGYRPSALSGSRCGVFAGCATGDYAQLSTDGGRLNAQGFTGGSAALIAARTSYFLDLQGPCLSIDTACSSSLVAIAQACDSLILGQCDQALAGGVCVLAGPVMHILASKAGMLSPNGRCAVFDQSADGFVPGEGVGVVMLKRLEDAVRDGDSISGVIRGWGVNQDGRTNGITAPSADAQVRLMADVHRRFSISPEEIQVIEAHGTGTKLGDPIEVSALKRAFAGVADSHRCALGSVKSNVGHLLMAAGIAGVIKVLLAMKHKQIPPTVHYRQLNEHIDLTGSPFYVNTERTAWEVPPGQPRMAGISAFGFSGTNAHLVIAEHSEPAVAAERHAPQSPVAILLSAASEKSLRQCVENLCKFLDQPEAPDLEALAYTLQLGRDALGERFAVVVSSIAELKDRLRDYLEDEETRIPGIFRGQVRRGQAAEQPLAGAVEEWLRQRRYEKLLDLWVNGTDCDWNKLYGPVAPRRLRLPLYPFAKTSYWISSLNQNRPAASPGKPATRASGGTGGRRICVIGAGPAGLVMAKSLLEEGHQPVVHETQESLGGIWNVRKGKTAGAYKNTRFQTSKYTSLFSDFDPPLTSDHFYATEHLQEYLARYAAQFHLSSSIHYNSEVLSVRANESRWDVLVRSGGSAPAWETFDGVALCNGLYWKPFTPHVKGLDAFRGEVFHAGQYYDSGIFDGKRVLVVGNGVSGMDIAAEASRSAAEVHWSMRSRKLVMPRIAGFVPNDFLSPASLLMWADAGLMLERLRRSMPQYFDAYQQSGLMPGPDDLRRNPIAHINDQVIPLVAEGRIRPIVSAIEAFRGNEVRFADPSQPPVHVDTVVFCTGYQTGAAHGFLPDISIPADFSMGIFYERNPTLVNASCPLPVAFSGTFYHPEMISRWYARLLSGTDALTESELRRRITEDHVAINGPLACLQFGLRLGLFPRPDQEFNEFWRLLGYPSFPAIYRLRGPHPDQEAAERLKVLVDQRLFKHAGDDQSLQEVRYRILAGLGKEALDRLHDRNEITGADLREAALRVNEAIHLDWESQYIAKGTRRSGMPADPVPPQSEYYRILISRLRDGVLDADGLVEELSGRPA